MNRNFKGSEIMNNTEMKENGKTGHTTSLYRGVGDSNIVTEEYE
tara:strand:+ start:391 stop:522 length:132 start_codon:yes stop_codon:yes gene_type:complete